MSVMSYLQRIGKALMTPVAVMPAAAILLRFGQEDMLNIPAIANAGNAIFNNLPLLFAIGVAIGLAGDAGVAGLSAMVSYFVLTGTAVSINKGIDMGVLGGILAGVLAGELYKRFKDTKLPDFLGFFGGKRFVPIITSLVSLVLGLVFGFVWPPIQAGIQAIGNWIVAAGAFGVFVFGVLNRLLIPFGLHHIINTLVWFTFGDFKDTAGKVIHGDLHRFFAGDKSAGVFMAGWYPVFMFGLLGAAFAMYQTAKPKNKAAIGGIMISAALTSFVTGITEPIEFAFMFISPVLFGLHALLSGLSMAVTYLLGIRHGFGFSAGLIDYVLGFKLATNPWLIIPLGLVFFFVYWAVFRFAIMAFKLKTPGREDDEEEQTTTAA